jgi:signal recognition particle subunit SRP19
MEKRNYKIIWPNYIDASKSRKEGRKVNLKLAIEKVKLNEIASAAQSLGFQYELEEDKSYPRTWWEKGRIKILNVNEKKIAILKKICNQIKIIRAKKI